MSEIYASIIKYIFRAIANVNADANINSNINTNTSSSRALLGGPEKAKNNTRIPERGSSYVSKVRVLGVGCNNWDESVARR